MEDGRMLIKKNIQEEKIIPENAKKLIDFCKKNGNKIFFIDNIYGENFDLKNLKIRSEIIKKEGEEKKDLINLCLYAVRSFLNGPIFLDDFSKNHGNRREWEDENEGKMDPEMLKYYNANRLGVNNYGHVIQSIDLLAENLKDVELKNKFMLLQATVPKELIEKDSQTGDGLYGKLGNQDKVKKIKELSSMSEEVVNFLEEKN